MYLNEDYVAGEKSANVIMGDWRRKLDKRLIDEKTS